MCVTGRLNTVRDDDDDDDGHHHWVIKSDPECILIAERMNNTS